MALRDDISSGESYFIVEIRSLKRILDESRKKEPLLCVIDEVLRANTIERIAASSQILNALRGNWLLSFAATHDIEISYILDEIYTNYHFEEEVREQGKWCLIISSNREGQQHESHPSSGYAGI